MYLFVIIAIILIILTLAYWNQEPKPSLPSNIPGPISRFWFRFYFRMETKAFVKRIEKMALKFGPVFKISKGSTEVLIVSDLNEILSLLKRRPDEFSRDEPVRDIINEIGFEGLFTLEWAAWKQSRNVIAPAISIPRVNGMKPCIIHHALNLLKEFEKVASLQEHQMTEWFPQIDQQGMIDVYSKEGHYMKTAKYHPSQRMNVSILIQQTVLAVLLETSFMWGSPNLLDKAAFENIKEIFTLVTERLFSAFPIWRYWESPRDKRAKETAIKIKAIVQKVIDSYDQERGGSEEKESLQEDSLEDMKRRLRRTILASLLDSRDRMSDEQTIGNLGQVMIAGFETASSTLHWSLMYLAQYPEIQKKVQEESDRVLPKDFATNPSFKIDTSKLVYTNYFLKEVLRHRPVAPVIALSTNQPTIIGGYSIPAGVRVLALTRLASFLYNPTPEPYLFNPDRWRLETSDSILYRLLNTAFTSFGAGPRVCPGRHMATAEMLIIISCVFASFNISFFPAPTGHEQVREVYSLTQKPENLYFRFEKRERRRGSQDISSASSPSRPF